MPSYNDTVQQRKAAHADDDCKKSSDEAPKKSPKSTVLLLTLSLALCLCYMGQSLLVTYSQTADGKYPYSHNSSVLFSELCKLFISLGLLAFELSRSTALTRPKITISWKGIRYGVPALLYALHNNIIFIALLLINPVTYQLFNNLKIITTAVVFRLFLNRKLTLNQWLAVILLLVSMVVVQLQATSNSTEDKTESTEDGHGNGHNSKHDADADDEKDGSEQGDQDFVLGFLWMLLLASCSAFAGVYNEYLIKGSKDSLNWQNIQLYMCSSAACLVQYLIFGAGKGPNDEQLNMFTGFNGVAWGVVVLNGILGQVVSLIFKYGDNIVKVYATSMAVLCTSFAANLLFDTQLTLALFIGIFLAILSLLLYFVRTQDLIKEDAAFCRQACSCCPCVNGPGKKEIASVNQQP